MCGACDARALKCTEKVCQYSMRPFKISNTNRKDGLTELGCFVYNFDSTANVFQNVKFG